MYDSKRGGSVPSAADAPVPESESELARFGLDDEDDDDGKRARYSSRRDCAATPCSHEARWVESSAGRRGAMVRQRGWCWSCMCACNISMYFLFNLLILI